MNIINRRLQLLRSSIAIFWLGFFTSISFVEAPLKFSVLTLQEGLSVGRVVFKALNTFEWAFLAILGISLLVRFASRLVTVLILIMCVILVLQSVWLLPVLDSRAIQIIEGKTQVPSYTHFVFFLFDITKSVVLLMIAWQGIKENLSRHTSP
ncbi:hypothetical protein [Pedobacter ginsengisoli]|uniref:hypothetical protein n=1 Tax=Pedobacter ginsengisoli TaxID=363852 RepID=UPI002550320B|nr:hypothetical protein [Pedobacter ginsengisoli]